MGQQIQGAEAQVNESAAQFEWRIIQRWQEYTAETRVNLIRAVGIAVFYSIQLIHFNFFAIPDDQLEAATKFHHNTTLLCAGWFAIVLTITYCLTIRWFPPYFKYITTTIDLFMLTAIASIGTASASPLVYVYFVMLVMAALRFDLWLIRISTAIACCCYVGLLAISSPDWMGAANLANERTVSRLTQLIVLAALILAGVSLGQIARRAQAFALEYHQRCIARAKSNSKEANIV